MFGKKNSALETALAAASSELHQLRAERDSLLRTQALAVCAADGSLLAVGDAFAALLGRAASDLIGKPFAALMTELSAPAWRDAWNSVSRGQAVQGEFQCEGQQHRLWLHLAATPAGGDGGSATVLCFATDLTALRADLDDARVELKVRQDIMNVTSIVSEADKKGDILSCNDKYTEISKYDREELIGKGHNITRHPDMPKAVFKEMWNTIGHGKIFRGVVKNRAKDGTPYYVDAVIAPILGDNGKP